MIVARYGRREEGSIPFEDHRWTHIERKFVDRYLTTNLQSEAATIETFNFQPEYLDGPAFYDQESAEQILDYPLSFSFVVPCFAADPVLVELY